jgi:hypothetical protein
MSAASHQTSPTAMIKLISLLLVCSILFTACGTIVNGSRQEVSVMSYPPGALLKVDGMGVGTTPIILDLERKDDYRLRFELKGFIAYEMDIRSKLSGWFFGNLISWSFIGMVVDAVSGGMYRLTPEQVMASLSADGTGAVLKEGTLYIGVVMEPQEGWEKIGQLERVGESEADVETLKQ